MDYPCICGRRFTTESGMKIHRTMGCLNDSTIQQQRTTQADQTSENQSQVQNHIDEEIHAEESHEEFRQLINAKRQRINIPSARADDQWKTLDIRIVLQLDKLIEKCTLAHKLSTFDDIVYQTCLNTFGVKHEARTKSQKSRRQQEMETLRKQNKSLKKQIKTATEEEKRALH